MRLVFKNGRVIDPSSGRDEIKNVVIENGKIIGIENGEGEAELVYDCTGKIVTSGLVDAHVHLREPGFEHKGTIATETAAAARGGFTQLVAMANLNPVPDNPETYQEISKLIAANACIKVEQVASITKRLEGLVLSQIPDLVKLGVKVFSDDGQFLNNTLLLYQALQASEEYGFIVSLHEEDPFLKKFEFTTNEAVNEYAVVARDIEVLRRAGGNLHLQHISTKRSVELIRKAKEEGLNVSAEVTPHHLLLTEEATRKFGTHAKMSPPLRKREDIEALIAGLADGTIDFIATDHAPHSKTDKEVPFNQAANGIVGIETALPLLMTEFNHKRGYSYLWLLEKLSFKPAQRFKLPGGRLQVGEAADLCILSPEHSWEIKAEDFLSKGRNTPFDKTPAVGCVEMTWVDGKQVYSREGDKQC